MKIDTLNNTSFNGRTKIYALSDTHQETRKTATLLSEVLKRAKGTKNTLVLNDGDMFKGIYPMELERDCYIRMKEENPDIEMVATLGNNDFGFNRAWLDFMINSVKLFAQKGIKVVSANIFDENGKRPEWLLPYTVVERDGDRTFVTGFCIDNINTAKFGIFPKKQLEITEEIKEAIDKEKPDNIVILNHDYMPMSREIVRDFKNKGINIDLTIGGHDHETIQPDTDLHIYHPKVFGKSIYEFDLINENGKKDFNMVNEYEYEQLTPVKELIAPIEAYEKESGLLDNIAPSVLNLDKKYSDPCGYGSFLSDEIKNIANTDIAFFSTGFLTKPLEYEPNGYINGYKLKGAMMASNFINSVELSVADLRDIFAHALLKRGYGESNPKFLQCSSNIKIEGKNNPQKEIWELKQIYIDNIPLLDENMNPINSEKKYTCAIDSYITEGGQGFLTLKNAEKKDIFVDGEKLTIDYALRKGLIEASEKYEKGSNYPKFELTDL